MTCGINGAGANPAARERVGDLIRAGATLGTGGRGNNTGGALWKGAARTSEDSRAIN